MSNQPALKINTSDGRFARSQKTKDAIVKALLKLLNDTPFPTAEQVARESKIGLRTVYRQFKDMESIYLSLHEECLYFLNRMFANEIDVNKPFEERINFAVSERLKIYSEYEIPLYSRVVDESTEAENGITQRSCWRWTYVGLEGVKVEKESQFKSTVCE